MAHKSGHHVEPVADRAGIFETEIMRVQQSAGSFALSIDDGGMQNLEARKVYQVLPDREVSRESYIRVIDESGEDYMYPSDLFIPLKLPAVDARRLRTLSEARTPRCASFHPASRTALSKSMFTAKS